jgi:pimeloyl-ACP methyl ester carboxylesterase
MNDEAKTCATNRIRALVRSVILGSLFWSCLFLAARGEAATLAGQEVRGGGSVDIRFPVAQYFQDYAAQGGNPRVETGRAVLMFPPGFDLARPWPILIVTSTTDANRTSPMDAEWYRRPATTEGWVVLAPDATVKPHQDSTNWRLGMLAAALEFLHKEWPQSAHWPVAFAGLSGGAKRSGVLGAMLAKSGTLNICGFLLIGINDDRLSEAYRTFHPSQDFLRVPIWLSSGMSDSIAPPGAHEHVRLSLQRTGFQHVRVEAFDGGHQVKPAEVQRALRWFREMGKF